MTPHLTESDVDRIIDRDTPDATRAQLLDHLAVCAACRATWEDTLTAHVALSKQHIDVPRDLSSRVARGAIQSRVERKRSWSISLLQYAAVLLLGIAVGALTQRSRIQPDRAVSGAGQVGYLFVFSGARSDSLSREQRSAIVRSFRTWTDSLRHTRQLIAVGQLTNDAPRLVAATEPNLDSATVRAFASMEGFYVLYARDDDDALALARACPYLRFGGTIVVRRRAGAPQSAVRVSLR